MTKRLSVQADKPLLKRRRGRSREASYTEINKAIKRFITRTEQIVQRVTPSAHIVLAAKKTQRKRGRPRKTEANKLLSGAVRQRGLKEKQGADKTNIDIPSFRGNFQAR
jgi:hypothetical protein